MAKWNAVVLVAFVVPGLSAFGGIKSTDRKVSVGLSFSVEEYDPTRPSKAVLKCAVQNDTPLGLLVPVGFDGGYVRVQAGGLILEKSKKGKDDVKLTWVEPGKEQIIFELPLDEVLAGAGKQDSMWHWSWQRRPEPPLSPIHKYRQVGFVDQASFTVSLDLGGYTLASEAASLKVKPEK